MTPSARPTVAVSVLEEGSDGDGYLRTEFLDRVAHELRGPAGVSLGALDELERLFDAHASDESRALFVMARRGAKRILRTAERLSRTAHLEAGPASFALAPVDMRDLVARAVREVEQIEGRSVVQVDLVVCDRPCIARVDASWMGAALEEVFAQAIRSARRSVQVRVQCEQGLVLISAEDDRAMNLEVPARRFVSIRDKRDSALGWPMASDIVHAHEGTLVLEPVTDTSERITGARALLSISSPR